MGLFTSKITDKDKAILDLKTQRDKLKVYAKKISLITQKETEIAKLHLSRGNKTGALIALKRKKYQENLLSQTENQLLTLEELTSSIEYALIQVQVLNGLELGNQTLKQLQKETNLETVQKLMDDTADAISYQNEIDQSLSLELNTQDQAEIEAELDSIINAMKQDVLEFPQAPDNALERHAREQLEFPLIPSNVSSNAPSNAPSNANAEKIKILS